MKMKNRIRDFVLRNSDAPLILLCFIAALINLSFSLLHFSRGGIWNGSMEIVWVFMLVVVGIDSGQKSGFFRRVRKAYQGWWTKLGLLA